MQGFKKLKSIDKILKLFCYVDLRNSKKNSIDSIIDCRKEEECKKRKRKRNMLIEMKAMKNLFLMICLIWKAKWFLILCKWYCLVIFFGNDLFPSKEFFLVFLNAISWVFVFWWGIRDSFLMKLMIFLINIVVVLL